MDQFNFSMIQLQLARVTTVQQTHNGCSKVSNSDQVDYYCDRVESRFFQDHAIFRTEEDYYWLKRPSGNITVKMAVYYAQCPVPYSRTEMYYDPAIAGCKFNTLKMGKQRQRYSEFIIDSITSPSWALDINQQTQRKIDYL